MSSFTTPLRFEFLTARLFRLTEPFEYHIGDYPSQQVIKVPAGFETDLASIPWLLWGVFPPDGVYTKAAVIHDFLYSKAYVSRDQADHIFYEAMGVLGVNPWTRFLIFTAVRLFGGRYYGGI